MEYVHDLVWAGDSLTTDHLQHITRMQPGGLCRAIRPHMCNDHTLLIPVQVQLLGGLVIQWHQTQAQFGTVFGGSHRVWATTTSSRSASTFAGIVLSSPSRRTITFSSAPARMPELRSAMVLITGLHRSAPS